MRIGIPREIKPLEGRIALSPDACQLLSEDGHHCIVEHDAGILSGYSDDQYIAAGASIGADAQATYGESGLIVKVKEPVAGDLQHLNRNHLLFCYLHLAPNPALTQELQEKGLTAVGFETVETGAGELPLLAPMSDIAGRLATQVATTLLHQSQGGKGLLLGGIPGADPGRVVIIGAGNAGGNAAALAAAIGAEVVVFDVRSERLSAMSALGDNVSALHPAPDILAKEIASADVLIGAALRTGEKAPHIVTRSMIRQMQAGSVVVDISVDQGGCIETTRPTSWENPTYIDEGVVHFCVTNMPGAVPRSATQALSTILLPFVEAMCEPDWKSRPELLKGINIEAGDIIHPALKESLDGKGGHTSQRG
jgi:alanine dehydrogenase